MIPECGWCTGVWWQGLGIAVRLCMSESWPLTNFHFLMNFEVISELFRLLVMKNMCISF